jgi:AhpC/TSA family
MKKGLCIIFLLAAASMASGQSMPPPPPTAPASTQNPGQTPAVPKATPVVPHTNLKVGQAAPDFTLPSTIVGPDGRGVRYKLSDFKGKKNVVLAFYVFAFTGG